MCWVEAAHLRRRDQSAHLKSTKLNSTSWAALQFPSNQFNWSPVVILHHFQFIYGRQAFRCAHQGSRYSKTEKKEINMRTIRQDRVDTGSSKAKDHVFSRRAVQQTSETNAWWFGSRRLSKNFASQMVIEKLYNSKKNRAYLSASLYPTSWTAYCFHQIMSLPMCIFIRNWGKKYATVPLMQFKLRFLNHIDRNQNPNLPRPSARKPRFGYGLDPFIGWIGLEWIIGLDWIRSHDCDPCYSFRTRAHHFETNRLSVHCV